MSAGEKNILRFVYIIIAVLGDSDYGFMNTQELLEVRCKSITLLHVTFLTTSIKLFRTLLCLSSLIPHHISNNTH